MTAQGKTAAAHKGLVHVAKVMACTAVDALLDDVLLARAKADHEGARWIFATAASGPWQAVLNNLVPKDVPRVAAQFWNLQAA